jgi:plasmid stability protein
MTPDTRVTVRLPADLAEALRQRAAADERSLNRELVFLLRQALFPAVEADAYRDTRRTLSAMPRYTLPRLTNRKPRGGDGA